MELIRNRKPGEKKPRKKGITVAARKAKGRALQQEICEMISTLIDLPYGKDCPVESRPMGQSGADVRLDAEARKRFPFSVECKFKENWDVPASIKQAKANQADDTDWLLFLRKSGEAPVVIMSATRFFELMKGKL
jgi:hypothetical protein